MRNYQLRNWGLMSWWCSFRVGMCLHRKTLKEAALEIPGILNTGLLKLKDRGMKLPMSFKVTVHSGYGEAFPNTSTSSLGCNTVALLFT